jgi:GMP synthase-like glutamine amidotransferase
VTAGTADTAGTSGRSVSTVGVLECDHVDEAQRPIAGDTIDMLRTLLGPHVPGLELRPYDVIGGELPSDPAACDAWICPGSRHSVYDDLPWIPRLAGFVRDVRDAGTPFVGICFGHQMLAHALGGRVARAASGWGAGTRRLVVDSPQPWMEPPAEKLALHFMHQDQVQLLPSGGTVLGRADHCPVALMAVGGSMVGMQPHPEFPAAYVDALLAARVARIGDDEVAAARAGLVQPTDEATVARWIARFVRADAARLEPPQE